MIQIIELSFSSQISQFNSFVLIIEFLLFEVEIEEEELDCEVFKELWNKSLVEWVEEEVDEMFFDVIEVELERGIVEEKEKELEGLFLILLKLIFLINCEIFVKHFKQKRNENLKE